MKVVILLLVLVGLIQAEVVTKSLVISEGENIYTQTITLNYDRNIQIIEVPQHNNIVHSRTIFDFKQGKLVESHPDSKTCYMRDIPKGTAPMKKFAEYVEKNPVIKAASNEKTVQKAFTARRKMSLKSLSFVAMEIVAECRGSDFYEVTEVSMDVQKVSINVAPGEVYKQLMTTTRDNGCHMPAVCLWQTCYVGSDSCYWTVNCPVSDKDCNDMIHNSNFHNNDNAITCKSCYNMQCSGCEGAWAGCGPVLAPQGVNQCPFDPDLGKDCGEKFCKYHKDVPGGEFECFDSLETGHIEPGHMCILFCEPGHVFGGSILCKEDGTWDDTGLTPGC